MLFTSCSQSKSTNKSGASNGVVEWQHVHNQDVWCPFFEIERIYPRQVHHVADASVSSGTGLPSAQCEVPPDGFDAFYLITYFCQWL